MTFRRSFWFYIPIIGVFYFLYLAVFKEVLYKDFPYTDALGKVVELAEKHPEILKNILH